MADKTGFSTQQNAATLRYKDMGVGDDGVQTYAEVVSLGDGTIEIGDVQILPNAKPGTGGTGTTAASAAAISTTLACQSILLQNTHATLTLKFGNSAAQPMVLSAGQIASIPATDASQIFVIDGSGHATFAWIPVITA